MKRFRSAPAARSCKPGIQDKKTVAVPMRSPAFRVAAFCMVAAFATATALAARPRYGGTLRIETEAAMRSYDPAIESADAAERTLRARVIPLAFETLVTVDADRGLQPALAVSWDHDDRNLRWRFRLRPSVRLHDGSTLQPPLVAAVIGAQERAWRAGSIGDAVVIDTDRPHPDLPWELAGVRFAIAARTAAGDLFGTGPFRIDHVDSRRIALRAFEDHWAGRPFLDAVQIEQGRVLADQLSSIELGRADLVAIRPTDFGRVAQHRIRTVRSAPIELAALVFEPHRSAAGDDALRRVVARSVDRSALASVLLQRQAEPATGLLPSWLSGFAPLFLGDSPPAPVRGAAAAERRTLVLRAEASDTVAQEIAARVAVDVRQAGLTITVQTPSGLAPRPDVRLIRISLEATEPGRALSAALAGFGPRLAPVIDAGQTPVPGAPLESVLDLERAVVERAVIVPLVHLRELYGIGDRVDSWNEPPIGETGRWNLANVWMRGEQ
jgi:ABC-type transport system substrate-binding protein